MQASQRKLQRPGRFWASLTLFGMATTACCAVHVQGDYPARPISQ
jgi:hypothetical protein